MRIKSVQPVGLREVFDISVEDNHNFLGEGVVLHNSGARKFCLQAQPNNIDDLAAITAIYRPGPLKANVHNMYVDAGKDVGSIKYDHPLIEKVLGPTRGFICLAGDAKVTTEAGEFTIEEIVQSKLSLELPTYNIETGELEMSKITQFYDQGEQETIIVSTSMGEIELTPNHVVYTTRGKIPACELQEDDEILSLSI